MSRQYDEYMEGKFESCGEQYEIVEPTNIEELMKAFQTKDVIEYELSCLMHDEDSSGWSELLQEQEDAIQEYYSSIPDFDNSLLIKNINYLAKKYSIRIGDLEKMLRISAGYISRTAKEGTAKKMSIDVVWKIARFFHTDLRDLVDRDLEMPSDENELLCRFIKKLRRQTEEHEITWKCLGGVMAELDRNLEESGLITDYGDDKDAIYHPHDQKAGVNLRLIDDVVACEDIREDTSLVIVPYSMEKGGNTYYDFFFMEEIPDRGDPELSSYNFEKIFRTVDVPFSGLASYAESLYQTIRNQEFSADMSSDVRKFITDYLK